MKHESRACFRSKFQKNRVIGNGKCQLFPESDPRSGFWIVKQLVVSRTGTVFHPRAGFWMVKQLVVSRTGPVFHPRAGFWMVKQLVVSRIGPVFHPRAGFWMVKQLVVSRFTELCPILCICVQQRVVSDRSFQKFEI
jgi:hypothetical protein